MSETNNSVLINLKKAINQIVVGQLSGGQYTRLLTLWLFWGMVHTVFMLVFNIAETFHWLGF